MDCTRHSAKYVVKIHVFSHKSKHKTHFGTFLSTFSSLFLYLFSLNLFLLLFGDASPREKNDYAKIRLSNILMCQCTHKRNNPNMISVFHNLSIYLFIFVSNRRCRHCWCCLCCLCCCCCFSPFSIHLFNKNKYNIRRHCCAAIYIALHPFQNFAQIVDGSIGYFLAYERCCLALTHSPTKSFAFFYYFQFASFIHLVDVCLCERSTIFILQSENC